MNFTALRICSLFVSILVWSLSSATEAEACSSDPYSGLSTPRVLPLDGQVAPPNTKIWVAAQISESYPEFLVSSAPLDLEDIVVRVDDEILAVDASSVTATAEVVTRLWILDPTSELEEGQLVEVWIHDQLASAFTVGGTSLTAPPLAPVLESLDVTGEYFGAFFCPEPAMAVVTVEDETSLLMLVEASEVPGIPADSLAIGTGRTATAYEFAPGAKSLQLIAVDIAGNVSEATPLPEFVVPPSVYGCSAAHTRHGQGSWLLIALVALAALRRKRQVAPLV